MWPGGVDGFQITNNAQAGILHYIGDDQTDVDVVYPSEKHVTLTGYFAGLTSAANMIALETVILEPASEDGKILGLPGVQSQLLYVAVINHQFNHDTNDASHNISYSIECIKTGSGSTLNSPIIQTYSPNPQAATVPRGKSQRRFAVRPGAQTLRGVANAVYRTTSRDSIAMLLAKNADALDKLGISAFDRVSKKLPLGTILDF